MAETTASDFEALSAYVDGALSASDAAMLAERIAAEPGLAKAAARLTALKAASATRLPTDPPTPPYTLPTRALPVMRSPDPRRMQKRIAAIAACLCAVVAGGALTTFFSHEAVAPASGTFEAGRVDALALHDAWSDTGGVLTPLANFDEERRQVMAATDLLPAFARDGVAGTNAFHQEGYVGANGCRVSVFLAPLGTRLSLPTVAGDALAAAWDQEGEQALLVARAMDPVRFAKLAAALRDAPTSGGESGDLIAALRSQLGGCPA